MKSSSKEILLTYTQPATYVGRLRKTIRILHMILKSSTPGIMFSNPVEVNQHFGGICHPHLQGSRVGQARYQHGGGSKQSNLLLENLGLYRKLEVTSGQLISSP